MSQLSVERSERTRLDGNGRKESRWRKNRPTRASSLQSAALREPTQGIFLGRGHVRIFTETPRIFSRFSSLEALVGARDDDAEAHGFSQDAVGRRPAVRVAARGRGCLLQGRVEVGQRGGGAAVEPQIAADQVLRERV